MLVNGIGPVGLMSVGANLRDAGKSCVGTRPAREAAKKYGATDFII